MSEPLKAVLQRRAGRLEASLARHRLVFLQLGSSFRVLRSDLLDVIEVAVHDRHLQRGIAICRQQRRWKT